MVILRIDSIVYLFQSPLVIVIAIRKSNLTVLVIVMLIVRIIVIMIGTVIAVTTVKQCWSVNLWVHFGGFKCVGINGFG